jgi:tRNA threonylcarbamoyladenosine biosynthesis protein TsaE
VPLSFTRTSRSEAETAVIGHALGRLIRAGDVILLDGPLGAGKTTLIRSIAAAMNLDTHAVASPTFVMMHEYPSPPGTKSPALIHVDAYRLAGAEELDSLGWDTVVEQVQRPAAALIIEWAERLAGKNLPTRDPARLRIDHVDPTTRELDFTIPDSWSSRPGIAELTARRATKCPITGQRVEPDSPTYPFANARARMADLNRWFTESYEVSRDATDADFDGEKD